MRFFRLVKCSVVVSSLLIIFSCKKEVKNQVKLEENDLIEIYNYNELKPLLAKTDERKIYVVNFWATWCAPCVKELPYFEELQASNENVEVLLVSLDFPDKFESQLIPFVKNKNLKSQVVLLDDPNENEWIADIDASWQGALPATLIYNSAKRAFYPKSFTKEDLFKEIEKFNKI